MACLVLLGDKRGDAALEEPDSAAEQDQADDERAEGCVRPSDDLWDCRNNDENVPECCQNNRDVDGLEFPPIFVGKPAAWFLR
jgi:hypothetical protein